LIQHDQQPVFLAYFVDALACLPDAIAGLIGAAAGFVGNLLSRPDDDRCRRDKHHVFIDNSPRL
jgi:hypothetical protein